MYTFETLSVEICIALPQGKNMMFIDYLYLGIQHGTFTVK